MTAAFAALDDFHRRFGDPKEIAMYLTPRDRCSPRVTVNIIVPDEDAPLSNFQESRSVTAEEGTSWQVPIDDELRTDATEILRELKKCGYFD